ncbi:transposase [bacterium]|nr:transposase [bacterium]
MSRIARVVVPDIPHHLTQRGNYRQVVFEDKENRERYLSWIKEYSDRCGVKIWAYCLMDNHVHFIVVPQYSDSLAKMFKQVHTRYSQYFNQRMRQKGHLWQGRFYSCPLDEVHLYTAVRYVERNPVRAGLVKTGEDYPWSSALSHVKGIKDRLLSEDMPLLKEIRDWSEYLSISEEDVVLKRIRDCTNTGYPAGNESFVMRLEGLAGRILMPKSRGRPRKGK